MSTLRTVLEEFPNSRTRTHYSTWNGADLISACGVTGDWSSRDKIGDVSCVRCRRAYLEMNKATGGIIAGEIMSGSITSSRIATGAIVGLDQAGRVFQNMKGLLK